MFEKLRTYSVFGNTYCGIEHTSKHTVEAILLQKQQNELVINNAFQGKTIEEIAQQLPKKQHAFLIVNNDEVLSRFIESTESESNRLLFNAFPNLTINEFYYEISSNGNFHNISICRKSIVDKLIETYQKHQITIIGFSLGNAITSVVNDFIEESNYYTSNALLTKENEVITGIQLVADVPKQSYRINGLDVESTNLLTFSGALSYILKSKPTVSNFEKEETGFLKNFKQQRFFSQFFMFGLGFILLMLLVNFFIFSSYYEAVELMKQTSQVNNTQKTTVLKLKTITDEKQKTVDDILKNSSSRSSYYIDAISNSLPNTIQLSALEYQPITKRIKKNEVIQLQENTLTISGISTDSDTFSEWIHTLESLNWIVGVTVVHYGSGSQKSTDFTLKINMSHE